MAHFGGSDRSKLLLSRVNFVLLDPRKQIGLAVVNPLPDADKRRRVSTETTLGRQHTGRLSGDYLFNLRWSEKAFGLFYVNHSLFLAAKGKSHQSAKCADSGRPILRGSFRSVIISGVILSREAGGRIRLSGGFSPNRVLLRLALGGVAASGGGFRRGLYISAAGQPSPSGLQRHYSGNLPFVP